MRISIILIFLSLCKINAQITRVYYELTYQPSKELRNTEKELDILEINSNVSVFQNHESYVLDSIIAKNLSNPTAISNLSISKKINHNFKILKEKGSKIKFKEILGGRQVYEYNEDINLKWHLSDRTKINANNTILNSAECLYGGRKWIAWYDSKMPINDGPYKFSGLPGLIYSIEDSEKQFSWNLIGIEKLVDTDVIEKNFMELQNFSTTNIKKKQFNQIKKNFEENPLGNIKESLGDMMNDQEVMKKIKENEKRELEYAKNHNNPIEIE